MVPISVTLGSSIPHCTYGLMRVLCNQQPGEGMTWAWFTDGSMWCADTIRKWTTGTIATLWDIPEGQWWREILWVGRTLNSTPGCSPASKEKWPDMWLYNSLWALANGLAEWSGTLKKSNWKTNDKICGGNIWIYINGDKMMKILLSHVNAHQRVISAVENVNNQLDRLTHSMDTSQSLLPAISVITKWTQWKKGTMVTEMEVMHGLSNMHFHLPWPTRLRPLLSAKPGSNRGEHWVSDMAPFMGVISQLSPGRLITLDRCQCDGKGSVLLLLE